MKISDAGRDWMIDLFLPRLTCEFSLEFAYAGQAQQLGFLFAPLSSWSLEGPCVRGAGTAT